MASATSVRSSVPAHPKLVMAWTYRELTTGREAPCPDSHFPEMCPVIDIGNEPEAGHPEGITFQEYERLSALGYKCADTHFPYILVKRKALPTFEIHNGKWVIKYCFYNPETKARTKWYKGVCEFCEDAALNLKREAEYEAKFGKCE